MPAIPDNFDLWVRRAHEAPGDPDRQADYVLGALMACSTWTLWNVGTAENPQPARVEIDGQWWVIVFDRLSKLHDLVPNPDDAPAIAVPVLGAAEYCLQYGDSGYAGILVNPGDFAFAVPTESLRRYLAAWRAAGAGTGRGYWIPNMTTEEEDFWQEHGVE